jgi:DNA-binding response OmpR family regulator
MADLTVLCVDADEDARDATTAALGQAGFDTEPADSVAAATRKLDDRPVDCVVTEYELGDGTGLDIAAHLRERAPDTPCILFTEAGADAIRTERREDVVVEYLPKEMPDAHESLVRLIENVVSQRTQVGYPLPPDEDERQAAIAQYDRPDLDALETFDRLAALAKSHFDVDVAFVGIVDAHEERFIACQGEAWETLEREDTICTHTIMDDAVFVVEDTHADPRFADNDRLDELNIRAYAGAPLRTPEGAAIGAFCLTHDEPRSFDAEERADLERFAEEAMEQLELRRRLSEMEGEGSDDVDGDGSDPTKSDDGDEEPVTGGQE